MIGINTLLQKLDDALDKVVHQKEPKSFPEPIVFRNRGISKECQANSSAIHRRVAIQ
ncbi:hypothetical protein HpHA212_03930 [Helicobacter pylori]